MSHQVAGEDSDASGQTGVSLDPGGARLDVLQRANNILMARVRESQYQHLATLRDEKSLWITTPGEVDSWWRQRAQMRVVKKQDGWSIEGPGKERAILAWASEKDGQLVVSLEDANESDFQYLSKATQ